MECDNCGEKISVWSTSYSIGDMSICSDCHEKHYDELKAKSLAEDPNFEPEPSIDPDDLEKIILTTETNTKDLAIEERLGVISSESALGMNMFRDIFTNVRDLVGGQSVSTQKILKDLKSTAFQDIREQAYKLGADAVVAIDLDYSEFSGSGRSMLFLVATGTAVKLKEETVSQDQT
ncbi:heavy metal-binding domain-containing protein [Fodinibius saliphilus]|uniref:heavy metal-binding domain-containing protein n=1 Tax=Fodinibius saliphilus TaxID=1920650 RepID=UPI001BB28F07|nr:heavy metal-binding domain-containing protein [Fodinibius saliphilus]